MSGAPMTPGEDAEPTAPALDYSPATVRYDEAFENSLMNAILYPYPGNAHDRSLLSSAELPNIPTSILPIPLDSPLRAYPSVLPGVALTHPNGYYTGGPGPSPATVSEYAKRFIEEHGIQNAGQLNRIVDGKVQELLDVVKERMREREKAIKKNEDIMKQLRDLEVQRSTERRVQEKIKDEKEKRRARKAESVEGGGEEDG